MWIHFPGGSEPVWTSHSSAGATVTDGGGSWINAGTQAYWNSAVNRTGQPYLNNLILSGGGVSQFDNFAGGLDKNRQRTGDAVSKSTATGTTTVTGLYSLGETEACNGGIGGGLFSPFSDNAGRGAAYALDSCMVARGVRHVKRVTVRRSLGTLNCCGRWLTG